MNKSPVNCYNSVHTSCTNESTYMTYSVNIILCCDLTKAFQYQNKAEDLS